MVSGFDASMRALVQGLIFIWWDGGFWNSSMHATALALMEGRDCLDGNGEAAKLWIEEP